MVLRRQTRSLQQLAEEMHGVLAAAQLRARGREQRGGFVACGKGTEVGCRMCRHGENKRRSRACKPGPMLHAGRRMRRAVRRSQAGLATLAGLAREVGAAVVLSCGAAERVVRNALHRRTGADEQQGRRQGRPVEQHPGSKRRENGGFHGAQVGASAVRLPPPRAALPAHRATEAERVCWLGLLALAAAAAVGRCCAAKLGVFHALQGGGTLPAGVNGALHHACTSQAGELAPRWWAAPGAAPQLRPAADGSLFPAAHACMCHAQRTCLHWPLVAVDPSNSHLLAPQQCAVLAHPNLSSATHCSGMEGAGQAVRQTAAAGRRACTGARLLACNWCKRSAPARPPDGRAVARCSARCQVAGGRRRTVWQMPTGASRASFWHVLPSQQSPAAVQPCLARATHCSPRRGEHVVWRWGAVVEHCTYLQAPPQEAMRMVRRRTAHRHLIKFASPSGSCQCRRSRHHAGTCSHRSTLPQPHSRSSAAQCTAGGSAARR